VFSAFYNLAFFLNNFEHFFRWSKDGEWEICGNCSDFGWMQIAEPVMNLYTEATDGSSIERKESALVWQYRDADLGFGSSQAKEMLDHLESVLANEPVSAKSGQFIVEVKPQVYIISPNDFSIKIMRLFILLWVI
jgi:trehalose 6-phosphate synthase/phosphatase